MLICIKSYNQEVIQNLEINDSTSITFAKEYRGDGSIVKEIRPYDYQLIPRNSQNIGFVNISGTITAQLLYIRVMKIDFSGDSSQYSNYILAPYLKRFSLIIPIVSELSEYSFSYSLNSYSWKPIANHVVCGDVYLISGQSNAITSDLDSLEVDYLTNKYGSQTAYGKFSRTYGDMWRHRGPWHVSEVTGTFQLPNFSVGAWGLALQYNISKQFGTPTCIINGAIGGTNIEQHLPPVNGPFFYHDSMPNDKHFFRHLNTRVYEAGVSDNIKGILWYQGDGGQDGPLPGEYINRFKPLYELWQQYFPNFGHFYVIQVHSFSYYNLPLAYTSEDQRIMPTLFNNCRVMASNSIGPHKPGSNHQIHFQASSYVELAQRLEGLLGAEVYNSPIVDFEAPDINYACKHNDTIWLQFTQNISEIYSDDLDSITSAFRFDKDSVEISLPLIYGKTFMFKVSDTTIQSVSYLGILPGHDPDFKCYLKNQNNIAALSFNNFPISTSLLEIDEYSVKNEIEIFPNPADKYFVIRTKNSSSLILRIYNATSQLILSKEIMQNETIDCNYLNNGFYIIQLIDKKLPLESKTFKLLINH
ncbi:MAG: T9SS type A sorting domain-containing protein [Bacteroidales bacterium]|nr:T9SS type A sorting domain-containing protein [Bacteroidales bacterium]